MENTYKSMRKQIVGWWAKNGLACLAVFAVSILAYFPYLSDVLSNPDGVAWWDLTRTPLWISGQGRWGLYISDYLKPPVNLSPLSTLWSLALYSLGGILFSQLLGNKTLTAKVITGVCIVCYPMVACTNTYWSCGFAIAFLFAVLSVVATVKIKHKWVGILTGSILLSVAVGNHQGQLNTAAGAGLMYLIALLIREPEKFRDWLIKARDILIMGLTGTCLYYLTLQVLLKKYGMVMESYGGGDKITPWYILTSLPETVMNCYRNFKDFFFSQNIMVNSYQVKPLYICFFLLFAVTLCLGIYRLRKKPLPCVALIGCVILTPLFCNIINLCTPDNPGVALHMASGLCLFMPFVFSVFSSEMQSALGTKGIILRIYDAAHAFGVKVKGRGIAQFGDASMFSFHATKVFHTVEGGCVVFRDDSRMDVLVAAKNFGLVTKENAIQASFNAKMTEVHAAMGLANLEIVDGQIIQRKAVVERYLKGLSEVAGIDLFCWDRKDVKYNYAYFPIRVNGETTGINRDELAERLERDYNVQTRKYFYPLLSDMDCYREISDSCQTPIAKTAAEQVLCLPLYADLTPEQEDYICAAIREIVNAG